MVTYLEVIPTARVRHRSRRVERLRNARVRRPRPAGRVPVRLCGVRIAAARAPRPDETARYPAGRRGPAPCPAGGAAPPDRPARAATRRRSRRPSDPRPRRTAVGSVFAFRECGVCKLSAQPCCRRLAPIHITGRQCGSTSYCTPTARAARESDHRWRPQPPGPRAHASTTLALSTQPERDTRYAAYAPHVCGGPDAHAWTTQETGLR